MSSPTPTPEQLDLSLVVGSLEDLFTNYSHYSPAQKKQARERMARQTPVLVRSHKNEHVLGVSKILKKSKNPSQLLEEFSERLIGVKDSNQTLLPWSLVSMQLILPVVILLDQKDLPNRDKLLDFLLFLKFNQRSLGELKGYTLDNLPEFGRAVAETISLQDYRDETEINPTQEFWQAVKHFLVSNFSAADLIAYNPEGRQKLEQSMRELNWHPAKGSQELKQMQSYLQRVSLIEGFFAELQAELRAKG